MACGADPRTAKPPPRRAAPTPLPASPYIRGVAPPAPPRRTLDFFCAVVIVGLLAGVAGLATTEVLRFVEHVTYHYSFGTLLSGITGSSPVRRALGPVVGGALAGLGWWILRRSTPVPPLAETVARRERI